MALSTRDKNVIKLIALATEMERAAENSFIFDRQFNEFFYHLSDEEKEIINAFNKEKENTDIIALTLEHSFENNKK
jgi:hypothetical protein